MDGMGKANDLLSTNYENLSVGDVNAEESNISVKDFCDVYGFKHLIKESTCYKNPNNPKCINLMLTNKNRSFQNSCAIETGLSDFHKMAVSVLKCYFAKVELKVTFIGTIIISLMKVLDHLFLTRMETYKIIMY